MKMRAKLFAARNYLHDAIAQLLGIERAYPHTLNRASLSDHLQQIRQINSRLQVFAITAEMHPRKNNFLEPARVQLVERDHHSARLDTSRGSARKRHDAECAKLVASFLQFQKRAGMAVERHSAQFDHCLLLAEVGNHHALAGAKLDH